METGDKMLQCFRAQVSEASIHKPVDATRFFDHKKDGEGFKVCLFKNRLQTGSFVLFFAIKENQVVF
jgi:hypothetical protein